MSIKDNLIQKLRPVFLIFLCGIISSTAMAQITSGDNEPKKKEKKEKTKYEFNEDSLSGTNYYLTGLTMWSYRTYEDQSVFGVLGEREKEFPAATGGLTIGLILPLSKYLSLDLGISYWGHGEKYAYQDSLSDSTYNYKRRYLQIGVPFRFRATYGEKLQGFMFAGVTLLNILQIRYDADYTNSLGIIGDPDEEIIKNDFAPFNIMAGIGAGINYNMKFIGLTLSAEYRRNLLNSYDTNELPVDHRMFGVAFNYGIYLRF